MESASRHDRPFLGSQLRNRYSYQISEGNEKSLELTYVIGVTDPEIIFLALSWDP